MKYFLFLLLIHLLVSQNEYDILINEEISKENCSYIIGNLTSLIEEGYIYNDYHKTPKQPDELPNYFTQVDLVKELNEIEKKDRKFFDFYREVETILEKTKDVHFSIYGIKTPNSFNINDYYYCIPFKYEIKENEEVRAQIILKYINSCNEEYDEEVIEKIKNLDNKVIAEINEKNPFTYIGEIGEKGFVFHSPQARYILMLRFIHQLPINIFPFKKEELHLSIKFDGVDELFKIDYQLMHKDKIGGEFQEFFFNAMFGGFENNLDSSNYKEKNQKEIFLNKNDNFWDIINSEESIKCKVDKEEELNVLFISSYMPLDIDEYDKTIDECFNNFYSNNYKLVIIDSQNLGGYAELCVPLAQYAFPKVSKPDVTAKKSTELICKNFFADDKIINPETCYTYTENDEISKGETDIYPGNIFHHKTKYSEYINIFQKNIMEAKRRNYVNTNKTKNPTEIIIFTDGFSFSCSSIFVRKMQIHGSAIIVGYNISPDLVDSKIDASQSSSDVSLFGFSENAENLRKLGFNLMITIKEQYDPNDIEEVKTPMEFKVYPYDEISDIYLPYNDNIYERFIQKAKSIFEKYNNLENETCNINNKYLYYYTEECDNQLNIKHAHGGFVCGNDSKWNQSECIAAYCDFGYILNDERTECLEDPCDSITLQEITVNEEKEYIIEPDHIYIFTIKNKTMNFSFYSDVDNLLFVYDIEHVLIPVDNGTIFENENKLYANFYVNITKNIKITITATKNEKDKDNKEEEKKKFPIYAIILIVVAAIIIIIGIILLIFYIKKSKVSSESIEEKVESLQSI